MAKNDIGGFFVSLGLNPDKNSFEQGQKLIDNVAVSLHKIIGAARNASVVLAGTAVATGVVESANYKTATAIGIATDSLDLWRASAKIAGVNADGLVGSMGKLANVVNRIKIDGAGLNEFSKQLGELGIITDDINMEEMLNMAPDELMEEIIRKAQEASAKVKQSMSEAREALAANPNDTEAQAKLTASQKENQRIITIVGDILGSEGQSFFIELERQGKGIEEFLAQAQKTILTDDEDRQKGADFAVELNTFKATAESLGKLVGDEVAGLLTDPLKEVNSWLQNNGDEIKKTVENISKITGEKIGKGIEYIHDWWKTNGDETKRIVGDIKDKVVNVIGNGISKMSEWWDTNGDSVKDVLLNTYDILKDIYDKVSPIAEKIVGDTIKTTDALLKLLKGDKTGALEAVRGTNYAKEARKKTDIQSSIDEWLIENGYIKKAGIYNAFNKANVTDLPQELQLEILGYLSEHKYQDFNGVKMQDGIMRPDGTVTQVAPDDWVFAVRNIPDMAEAITPQQNVQITQQAGTESIAPNTQLEDMGRIVSDMVGQIVRAISKPQAASMNSNQEYTINQTFNIQGGTNDMPVVLKQQAYRGTQDALMQAMEQSSRRMQMMSGTR